MKTKLLSLVAFAALVALAVQVSTAGAQHALFALFTAQGYLRPGVSQAGGHPRVNPPGLYGAFDATYYPRTAKLQYDMRWKALRGSAFRLVIRSRETGAVYAVLCGPLCRVTSRGTTGTQDGLQVSGVKGTAPLTRDTAYLMAGGYTFIELDTTAFPSGEIGAPIYGRFVFPGQPVVRGEPRCC